MDEVVLFCIILNHSLPSGVKFWSLSIILFCFASFCITFGYFAPNCLCFFATFCLFSVTFWWFCIFSCSFCKTFGYFASNFVSFLSHCGHFLSHSGRFAYFCVHFAPFWVILHQTLAILHISFVFLSHFGNFVTF